MKFRCDSCNAKYQIADAKIGNRVLRMKCRRCGGAIVVRGEETASSVAPAPTPSPAQSGVAEKWHVAINQVPVGPMGREELRSHIVARRIAGDSLAWCEGMGDWQPIRDIPSLASLLRQGRPASPRRHVAPPPPPRPVAAPPSSSMVSKADDLVDEEMPTVVSAARPAPEPVAPAAPEPPAPEPVAPAAPEPPAPEPVAPAAPEPPAPEPVAPAAAEPPAPEPVAPAAPEPPASEPVAPAAPEPPAPEPVAPAAPEPPAPEPVAPAAPEPPAPEPVALPVPPPPGGPAITEGSGAHIHIGEPLIATDLPATSSGRISSASLTDIQAQLGTKTGGMPLWAKLAMVAVFAMASSFGVVVGLSVMRDAEEAPRPVALDASVTVRNRAPQLELVAVEEETPPTPSGTVAVQEEADQGRLEGRPQPGNGAGGGSGGNASTKVARRQETSAEVTAAQEEMMRRMGGDLPAENNAPNIDVTGAGGGAEQAPSREPLTSEQLSRVVTNNRRGLQRCYERAIRGMPGAPRVRVNVTIRILPSGRVQRATITGDNVGTLHSCIDGLVTRWVFPRAGAPSETRFPVVFQSGS